MDKIHALAVMIVLCLVIVVSSGLFWHLWQSWGNLVLGEIALIGVIAFIFRGALSK